MGRHPSGFSIVEGEKSAEALSALYVGVRADRRGSCQV